MPAEPRYCAAPANSIVRVEMDMLTAVFDRRSGQTHLLAPPLPDLLDALGSQPYTLTQFAALLADQFDLQSDDGDAVSVIAERLGELVELGLVESG